MELQIFNVVTDGQSYDLAAAYRRRSEDLLFFIHAIGCSHDSFRHAWTYTPLEEYSLLAVDLVGFGGSSKPSGFSYSMEDQARICSALLRQLKYKRLHMVVHSMGGAVGLLLSQELLDSIASFTNVEGNLIAQDCGIVSRRAIGVPFETFQAEILPEYREQFKGYASLDLALPLGFYRSSESLVQWSDCGKLLDIFSRLACPKRYFYGDKNRGHPTVLALKEISTVEISQSGHFPMLDNPVGFYSELAKFLAPVEGSD